MRQGSRGRVLCVCAQLISRWSPPLQDEAYLSIAAVVYMSVYPHRYYDIYRYRIVLGVACGVRTYVPYTGTVFCTGTTYIYLGHIYILDTVI
jgi:hypothetical protein